MPRRLAPAEMPGWPRRMGAALAAAYLGISPTKFLAGVRESRYPEGEGDGGNRLWDRLALDAYVDGLPGKRPASEGDDPVMERIRNAYGPAASRKHRAA